MNKIKALVKKVKGKLLAVASEEVEDRAGEVISIDGWDLRNFKSNPRLLWSHDHNIPSVGNAENIKFEEIKGKKKLVFEPKFHGLTALSDTLQKMYENGFLNAFSVGFMPKEADGNKYTKQELLEISCVNVPALASALVMEQVKSLGFEEKSIKQILDNKIDKELLAEIKDSKEKEEQETEDKKEEDTKEEQKEEQEMKEETEKEEIEGDNLEVSSEAIPNDSGTQETDNKEDEKDEIEEGKEDEKEETAEEVEDKKEDEKIPEEETSEETTETDETEEDAKEVVEKIEVKCECLDCGHIIKSTKHCLDIKCPKCGGKMRRATRPGVGRDIKAEEQKLIDEIISGKPYPNEHACRLEDPSKYDKFRREKCAAKKGDKCIDFIYGIKEDKSELQSMRFEKDIWTESDARDYCESKDGSFEPAAEKEIETEIKEGRVLSGKNKKVITSAIKQLEESLTVLRALLEQSEPQDNNSLGGSDESEDKSRNLELERKEKERKALKIADKAIEYLLREKK